MKTKYNFKLQSIFILIAMLILNYSLLAQSGWYPLQSGTNTTLQSVYFVNPSIGYMCGDGLVIKTFNGGLNWLVINEQLGGKSIQFLNEYTGYLCEGKIHKTTDGGISWTSSNTTLLNSLYFIDANTGYAVGKNSQILKTTDGGLSWHQQFVSLFLSEFNSVCFINSNIGFVIGGRMHFPYFGIIYKTTNGGNTWLLGFSQAPDISFTGISFPSSNTGYVVGKYEYGSSGVIYKTTNQGESWIQYGIVNKNLNDVFFSNVNIGYAVGEDGTILKTTNGSAIWNSQISNNDYDIHSVYFVRNDLGFTAGNRGSIQKTINGGNSGPPWAIAGRVLKPNGQPITDGYVKALRYNRILDRIEVLDSAQIQLNGDYLLPNVPQDTLDIMACPDDTEEDFTEARSLFVPTYYTGQPVGTIHWQEATRLYVNGNLFNRDIRVFEITGTSGQRIISGGVYIAPPNSNPLKDAIVYAKTGNEFRGFGISIGSGAYKVKYLAEGNYNMICDRFGYRSANRNVILGSVNIDTINFYLTNVNVIGIDPNGTNIPSTYNLHQNYPNPFNPTTKINVDIPVPSEVKLIVYDMLGREVDVILNTQLNAGSHKIDWNGSKYSSGIYFYRITASDTKNNKGLIFSDVKKMILVK